MLNFSDFIAGLKLPTKTIVAVCIASAILLFSSEKTLESLGLSSFANDFRSYIGALFVVSLCISAVTLAFTIPVFVKPWATQAFWIRQHTKRLHSLTPDEKATLSHYIGNNTRSQSLSVQSGTVNALIAEKIIYRASSLGSTHGFFDHVIQPWAWEYLNKNPDLLK
jgi:Super-infection exclusion protein B